MPEVATESFCERCGARYAVDSGGVGGLRRARAVFSGLTHYVMSQDSLADAMADASRTEEERLQSLELDAFHSTFHFCLNCRQYACANCWNADMSQCRTCQPMVGPGAPHDPLDVTVTVMAPEARPAATLDAWPTEDVSRPVAAWPDSEPVVVAEVEPEPEPESVYEEPEPVVVAEAEDAAPTYAPWLLTEVPAADADLDERRVEVAAETYEPELVVAPEPELELDTPELAARRAKLDLLGLSDPGQGSVSVGAQDALPYRSSGAAPAVRRPRALAARMAAAGIWDASAREVAASGGSITDCGSCGLSLSASARFCRRCGTPQAKSA